MTIDSLLNELKLRDEKVDASHTAFDARKPATGMTRTASEPTEDQMSAAEKRYFGSIGLPLQLAQSELGKGLAPHAPILASVMLNQQAVESIQGLVKNPPLSDRPPIMESGAMLTKAIWTVRTLDLDDFKRSGICLNQHAPFVTKVQWRGKYENYPSMPDTLPNPNDLEVPKPTMQQGWFKPEISCTNADSRGDVDPAIPVRQFHAFAVHTKGVPISPPEPIAEASEEAVGRAAVQAQCGNKENCLALMMGIHIMVKISPADGKFGLDTTPVWVFMTFWWTPKDNKTGLPEPWNHYQLNVTTNPRVDHSDGTADNVIFNPYLEGTSKPAGARTNCVNCHSLARYNAMMTGDDLRAAGSTCGSLPIGKSVPQDCGCSGKYLSDTRSATIDKVWSIVSLLDTDANDRRKSPARHQVPKK